MAVIPQTYRASFDFLAALGAYAAGELYAAASACYDAHADGRDAGEDFESRIRTARQVIEPCAEYRYNRLITRMTAEQAPSLAFMAAERMRLEGPAEPEPEAGEYDLDADLELPGYFTGVTFHNQPKDMIYELIRAPAGPHYGKLIERAGCAAVRPRSDLLEHRRLTAAEIPGRSYVRILDVGCGHGTWTATLQRRFPDAEIHAIDLWPGALRATSAVARVNGWRWHVKQAAGEATGYPDGHFDLVTSYALLHELPAATAESALSEMFRVLAPEGDLMCMDVPPYREITDFQLLLYDWETEHRAEPYWREEGLLDRGELCRRIGFVDVSEYAIGETGYPWLLRARKDGEKRRVT
jgi:SAM-dependent methyltransferase